MARKVIQRIFGGPEVLEVIDVPKPELSELVDGEVIVRVAAAGLNPVDYKTRAGGAVAPVLGTLPFTIGWDLAGTVDEVAAGVSEFQIGDRVFGMSRFPGQGAAYAQFAIAAVSDLMATPSSLTDDVAAALPLAALTAWQALTDMAQLQPGQRVLIQGAGGGVGHLAVQMAHHTGAYVIATGSAGKREWLTNLGVDQYIDYTSENFVSVLRTDPVDVVLDLIAGQVGIDSAKVIKKGGLLLQFPSGVDPDARAAADAVGVRIDSPSVHLDKPAMTEIAKLAEQGSVVPTVAGVFGIDQVVEAHQALEKGHVPGKLVLRPW